MPEPSGFAQLDRQTLARLVPELLLTGHLIDRAAMPHVIVAFGREGVRDISVEEWMGASPIYTRRMRDALGYVGDDVETIFKGLQLDIGAPPQFMDFRYTVHDAHHGEFALAHCGALMDVEPMGDEYVHTMCHEIEDPTFDATAIATNPRARIRPIHRPPRAPVDRHPHCAWTVRIEPDADELDWPAQAVQLRASAAAQLDGLSAIDPAEDGIGDYRGPLLADLDFTAWSRSALVRIAEEICLQQHLLSLAFAAAVGRRLDAAQTLEMRGKAFAGTAGLTAQRLRDVLGAGRDLDGLAAVLAVHPALNPVGYCRAATERGPIDTTGRPMVRIDRRSGAASDAAWPTLLLAGDLSALQAIANEFDPFLRPVIAGETDEAVTFAFERADEAHRDLVEVQLARFSTGASFAFTDRSRSLPLLNR